MKFGVQLYSLRERAEKGGAEEVLRLVTAWSLPDFTAKRPQK